MGDTCRKLRDALGAHIKDLCLGIFATNKKLTGYLIFKISTNLYLLRFNGAKYIPVY